MLIFSKKFSDSLTTIGTSVCDCGLVVATLHGLPDEFKSFNDSIMLRLASTSLDELHSVVLTKKLFMAHRKK